MAECGRKRGARTNSLGEEGLLLASQVLAAVGRSRSQGAGSDNSLTTTTRRHSMHRSALSRAFLPEAQTFAPPTIAPAIVPAIVPAASDAMGSGAAAAQEIKEDTPTSTIVRLNVGGVRFSTTLGTLRKYPDSFLGAMFSDRHGNLQSDESGTIWIDRDPVLFGVILQFLRQGL